jgi:hypothetical protein
VTGIELVVVTGIELLFVVVVGALPQAASMVTAATVAIEAAIFVFWIHILISLLLKIESDFDSGWMQLRHSANSGISAPQAE